VKLYTMRILIAMLFTGGSSSDKYSIDKNRAVWCYRTSAMMEFMEGLDLLWISCMLTALPLMHLEEVPMISSSHSCKLQLLLLCQSSPLQA
jgi:hypothetical protein